MAPPPSPSQQPLLPSFLYAPPSSGAAAGVGMPPNGSGGVVAGSPSEPPPLGRIEMFSPAYYAACGLGGAAACGLTHAAVTPLDVIKCNIQIDPAKYRSTSSAFGVVLREQGARGFFRGNLIARLLPAQRQSPPTPQRQKPIIFEYFDKLLLYQCDRTNNRRKGPDSQAAAMAVGC